jgi:hypothetical protein
MDATEAAEKLIRELEAEQASRARFIADLKEAVARARNGSQLGPQLTLPSPEPHKKGTKPIFERKYDQNARELTLRVLREKGKPLHVGQIQQELEAQGFEFIKPTIALSLKQLKEKKLVRQVKATPGLGFTYAWIVEKERPVQGSEDSE